MSASFRRSLLAAAACGLAYVGTAPPARAADTIASRVVGPVTQVATFNLRDLARGKSDGGGPVPQDSARTATTEFRSIPLRRFPAGQASASAELPNVADAALSNRRSPPPVPSLFGFGGLDHYDQRYADNGNQFSLEPPDQALAVGNGYVLEAVNNALNVYNTSGRQLLKAPVSMNRFMGQFSEYNRKHQTFGPSLSDPRAFYDAASQRFFVVEWATLNNPNGSPLNIAVQFIATSMTSDPTGMWSVASFETTNSDLANCPCFGDYQQLGIDANGVFVTANLFGITSNSFAGAKIYALSKAALEAGTGSPVLEFPASTSDFTVHPTVVPPGGKFAPEGNGTEYLVESEADLTQSGNARSVKVFAISNTASLSTSQPQLTLTSIRVGAELVANGTPNGLPPAVQKDGPRPLGGPSGLGDPTPLLNADDARFSATPVYVNGQVWAAAGTALRRQSSNPTNGVAWFDLAVSGGTSALSASVTAQGYIKAPGGSSLLYPAIAMPASGTGGIGFTIIGPKLYPSTAVASLSATGAGPITMAGTGALPDDGFTAYSQYGGNGVGRWGDYGAAAVDETGALWFAGEYIPSTVTNPRSTLANWGTFITRFQP